MEYSITKVLSLFIYPLGLVILVGFVSMLSGLRRRQAGASITLLFMVSVLWVCSTPVFSDLVLGSLEKAYPPVTADKQRDAEAIVVLGGVMHEVGHGDGLFDLGGSADRLVYALRLYRAGKAPVIALVGGSEPGMKPESELMADLLAELGVERNVMMLETGSRSTRQNAVNSVELMKTHDIDRILLVTSAFHMKRAKAAFEALDMDVIPAATDYQVTEHQRTVLDWLPDAEVLVRTTYGLKEYIGWWVYKVVGWI